MITQRIYLACALILLFMNSNLSTAASRFDALVDARVYTASGEKSWADGGLGKQSLNPKTPGIQGQGVLAWQWTPASSIEARVVANAIDDRAGVADITEASLRFRPLPRSAWRQSLRIGAFFPDISLENDGPGWTSTRSISTSAVNAWIGEEIRTIGAEWTLERRGRLAGSPHDLAISLAVFGFNDPAGAMLAWRGWSIGEHITGLNEELDLPEIPSIDTSGTFNKQAPATDPFREIDHRPGWYANPRYAHTSGWNVSAMVYDNRGDPGTIRDGHYAWRTRFHHVGVAGPLFANWSLTAQWIQVRTQMGPSSVGPLDADYSAAYLGLHRQFGDHAVNFRADFFSADDRENTPDDPNQESGRAFMLNYAYAPHSAHWSIMLEALLVESRRSARVLIGDSLHADERSLVARWRWRLP